MRGSRKLYSPLQTISALFMIVALLWLTISAPFVIAGQKQVAKFEQQASDDSSPADGQKETANPFGNNTEEKSQNSTSISEEYLHDHHKGDHFISVRSHYHKCENSGTYIAFHGELLVPPPNLA